MRLPKSFNDVTVKQFQECYFILNASDDPANPFSQVDKWIDVIHHLSGFSKEQLNNLPGNKRKLLISQLQFLLDEKRLNTKLKKHIVLNGRVYRAVHEIHKLNNAQAIDFRTFMKPVDGMSEKDTVVMNAHKLLASAYLPLTIKGFIYDGLKHNKISEDFLSAKMGDVYGVLFFYSRVWESWINYTAESGLKAVQTIQEHIDEVMEWMKDLEGIGAGK